MMLPILISVSEAPVSYFFCAKEGLPVAASNARAAAMAPRRRWLMGIRVSLDDDVSCSWRQALRGHWSALNTFHRVPATKSPSRRSRGARFLVAWAGMVTRAAEY